jgi:predicted DCC family thiol-disulfide oxidoreductase YuxK
LVLFDGECAFCRRCIEYARQIDSRQRFNFQPSQTAQHPRLTLEVRARCAGAVHVIPRRGKILRGGRACFFVLEEGSQNPLVKRVARLFRSFPLVIPVEIGYAIVARNRSFFSKFF